MSESVINIEQIFKMLPHRYPMLLVDRIVELAEDSLVALKNVTFNEPYFNGHFPNKPVMPGVLIIEAMAQASGIFVMNKMGEDAHGKLVYFMSIEEAKFRKPVTPGDSLHIHAKVLQNRKSVWKFECVAKVGDTKVAEAKISAMIAVDK